MSPILGPPRGNLSTIPLESLKPIQPVIVIYLSVPERVSFCVISLINHHSRSYPSTHSSNSALYIKHFLTRFIYPFHTIYSPGHQTAKCANIRNEAKGKKKGAFKGYYQHRLPIPSQINRVRFPAPCMLVRGDYVQTPKPNITTEEKVPRHKTEQLLS